MNRDEKKFVVFKYLINKMLKSHGVDYDYVENNPKIDGEDWFRYYTWTEDEQSKFLVEGVEYVRQILRVPRKRATSIMAWFLVQYGLKTVK